MAELETKIQWRDQASEATHDARKLSERDRDYYDNHQLTEQEISVLQRRKQPVIIINRIKPKVDFLLGMERQTRTDPKAYPRTPAHEQDADSATDSVRYVADNNQIQYIFSSCFKDLLLEGTEAVDVYVKPRGADFDILVKKIQWDRIFYDHHSREEDFSDAKFYGQDLWMDYEDAKARWKGKGDVLEGALGAAPEDDTYEDTPRHLKWSDAKRKRLRVVEMYYHEGSKWYRSVFCKGGELEPSEPCPYLDEDGEPEPNIILQSAHADRNGNRYGAVRTFIGPQDEINKRRSKTLHLLSVRQTFGNKTAFKDVQAIKTELAKPDGHIEMQGDAEFGKDFGILPTSDLATAHFQLLQEAKSEIDAQGVNAAMQGKEGRDLSGRALQALQSGGQIELGPMFDQHGRFKNRVYRRIWNCIRQYWTEEKWLRVTDEETNIKWTVINQAVTVREQIEQEFGGIPARIAADPRLDMPAMDNKGQPIVRNKISELDVDFVIEQVPDSVTIQTEEFDKLVRMYEANPQGVPWEMVIQASQLRNKQQIIEALKGNEEQQQLQSQQQQEATELQKRGVMAEIAYKEAGAMEKQAGATKKKAEAVRAMMI